MILIFKIDIFTQIPKSKTRHQVIYLSLTHYIQIALLSSQEYHS